MGLQTPLIITPKKKAVNIEEWSRTIEIKTTMSAADVQREIDSLGRYLANGVTITFQLEDGLHSWDDQVKISGFLGPGRIYIFGNSSDNSRQLSKNVVISTPADVIRTIWVTTNFNFMVYIAYIKFQRLDLTTHKYAVVSDMVAGRVWVDYCSFEFSNNSYGNAIYYLLTTEGQCHENYFKYGYRAIYCTSNAFVRNYNGESDSSKPAYGLWASLWGKIRKEGTVQPSGSSSSEHTELGGEIL